MPKSISYKRRIEDLFKEAEDLFARIKDGEKCDKIIPDALALDARFDDAGESLLQGLHQEWKDKIDKAQNKKSRAFYYYERFVWKGIVFGPHFWRVDRMARVCYRNYKDGENDFYRGLATKRDYVIDTMKDVHDWMYHYANTISGWWVSTDFGNYYAPPMGVEIIGKYLPGIPGRTYSTLMRVLRPSTPRPQYQWEAIARIIYDCPYFKGIRKKTTRTYEKGKAVKVESRLKAWSFNEWCEEFTRLVGIPDFIQKAGNKQVAEEIERLKKLSGKDGGLKFLLTNKRV